MPSWHFEALGGDSRYLPNNLLRLVNIFLCGSLTGPPAFVQGSKDWLGLSVAVNM